MKTHFTYFLAVYFSIQIGQGAVLVTYNFTGGSAVDSAGAAKMTASTFTVSGTANGGISGSSNEAFMRSNGTGSTLGDAITGTDYFEFNITVDAGYQMELTSLSFDHRASVNSGPLPFQSSLSTFTSIDGFIAGDVLSTSTANQTTDTGPSSVFLLTETVTFSGSTYQT